MTTTGTATAGVLNIGRAAGQGQNFQGRMRHRAHARRGERTARHYARSQQRWLFDLMHRDRLAIAFQPICHSDDPQNIFAHECLLRAWDGDSLIYPDALFRAAQMLDCTAALDLAARALSLQQVAAHDPIGKIFVNLAPCFGGEDARRSLRRTIQQMDELGLERERIVFEITESENLLDWNEGMQAITAYREAGFMLALDDFGAGYSSLKLLHRVQPDYIKLDQCLLRDVHLDASKSLITRKLLELAQDLEIPTIAEGIECEAEYDWAREHGADYVQGFHLAVPGFPPFVETASEFER